MFSDNTNITFLFFFTICARSLFILFNVVIFLDLNKHIPPLMRIIILNSICPLTDTHSNAHNSTVYNIQPFYIGCTGKLCEYISTKYFFNKLDLRCTILIYFVL